MPALYLIVYYDAGLYADMAINIYYLVIALYGWAAWRYGFSLRRGSQGRELSISHTPAKEWLPLAGLTALLFVVIAQVLIHFTDSTVPWADAFTTALSVVGMWMLARKYIEQWWVWMVVDVASVALYVYKDLHFTAVLYALYAVVAIFGYRKWKQLMTLEDEKQ
jgi:nicotinamide mononucleotide transporter